MIDPRTIALDGARAAALAAAVAWLVGGADLAVGVLVSAAFATVNLAAMAWMIRRLSFGLAEGGAEPTGAAVVLGLKSMPAFGVAWLVFTTVGPAAFVIGLFSVLCATCIRALLVSAGAPAEGYGSAPRSTHREIG